MNRFRLGTMLGLGMVVGISLAQDAPKAAGTEAVTPKPVVAGGRITGTVTCADTHRPARGAMVMVAALPGGETKESAGKQNAMVRVGMDGTFAAEHLAPGEYTVIALLPGYLSGLDSLLLGDMNGATPEKQREMMARNGTVELRGAETATRDVVLTRGAAVSGRVLYSDGSPATQVTILVEDAKAKAPATASAREQMNFRDVFGSMLTHQSNGTDDQGRFRIAGLPPGSYRVAAAQIGAWGQGGGDGLNLAMAGMPDAAAMHFYSGDTASKSAARVYELRSGDEVADITITIPDTLLHQVRGSLAALGGKTITSATVTLKDSDDGALNFSTDLSQEDTFAFPQVPAGTYTLAVTEAKSQNYVEGPPQADGEPPRQPPPTLFADETRTVVVKDGDLTDANFTLKEVAQTDSTKQSQSATPPLE